MSAHSSTNHTNSSQKKLSLTLNVWRQKNQSEKGDFVQYKIKDVSTDVSFLEMLDILNQEIISKGDEPIAFDHDCREGICGSCAMVINGNPHGPDKGTTTCQLHMRRFQDGETLWIEPFRARAFPVIKDLSVDRSAFDRIIAKGGFISANTGSPADANALPIPHTNAELAFDAAACIGCGACVAACKNASAMLFVSAKVSHLALLPQGEAERNDRVLSMVGQMDEEGFGNCTVTGACEAACPKEISLENIARLNREFGKALITKR
ncbi:MAG: succinate dehydrogenase/fumarate reductase iron-sulfur subunit [Proteobacteria bacterium]|nr:succinate dehydrogenase/fumarate reductase iron-sulfur subunit [Pseudomonadota bacterium]